MNWKGQREVSEETFNYSIIYIPDERVYGEIISYGTYASKIRYSRDGIEYQILMLNEDFEIIEEVHIGEVEEEI